MAVASEIMVHATKRVKAKKPFVVFRGDVTADVNNCRRG